MTELADRPMDPVRTEIRDGVAVVIINSPPVNALSHPVRLGLLREIDRAAAEPGVTAIVILCEGRTFIAGADIKELGTTLKDPVLRHIQDRMDQVTKPIVAAMHGNVLGGGMELALAAHFRVSTPSARLGLPEVKLGVLPGAGGTQRLPRVVGLEVALEMIAFGEPVDASEALRLGLVDALVGEETLAADAIAFARRLPPAPLLRVRDRAERLTHSPDLFDRFRERSAAKLRGLDASESIVRCVEAATRLPFEEGLLFERACFEELVAGEQSAAMRYQFFAQRSTRKLDQPGADKPPFTRLVLAGAGAEAARDKCAEAGVSAILEQHRPPSDVRNGDLVLDVIADDRWTPLNADVAAISRYALGPQGSVIEIVARSGEPGDAARITPLVRVLATACVVTKSESAAERLLAAGRAAVSSAFESGVDAERLRAGLSDYGFSASLVGELCRNIAADASSQARAAKIDDREIVDRCVGPFLREALETVRSGIVASGTDLDVLSVLGLGWPIYRGGPVFSGERMGLPA